MIFFKGEIILFTLKSLVKCGVLLYFLYTCLDGTNPQWVFPLALLIVACV